MTDKYKAAADAARTAEGGISVSRFIANCDAVDHTESLRREMLETNQPHVDLAHAEQRWDTDQLRAEFEVIGFMAPFVAVRRKSDGAKGSMEFTHSPRFYFNFVKD